MGDNMIQFIKNLLSLKRSNTFELNLIHIFTLYTIIFAATVFVYGFFTYWVVHNALQSVSTTLLLSEGIHSIRNSLLVYLILSTVVFVIVCLILSRQFMKNIYIPIVNIEKAIYAIAHGDMDINIDTEKIDRLYALSGSLNSVINLLRDLTNREYNAKLLKKQAELNALQSQINPHFLYNTLESIRSQALSEGVPIIASMTKALSNLFRYSISHSNSIVTLREELMNVDNYLTIQQFRFNDKFTVIKQFDEDAQSLLNCKIPKLTIQPIVENAVFHGLETKPGNGTIIISAISTRKRLVIKIEDDGIGISEQKLLELTAELNKSSHDIIDADNKKGGSIALQNVNDRIKLYFGSEYGMRVYSTLNLGTSVELVLPLITG